MSQSIEPTKWKKYGVLEALGLIGTEEINNIWRYPSRDLPLLKEKIRTEIIATGQSVESFLFVLKLVPLNRGGQLPNYRLTELKHLDGIENFVAQHSSFTYVEVWCCKTRIDAGVFSVAGRISFDKNQGSCFQCLEQVWRCSPRMLEYYTNKGFDWPYARAARAGWARSYKIIELYHPICPNKLSSMKEDLMNTFVKIEAIRSRLQLFEDFLDSYGFSSFSFEYKIVEDNLSIIDWDTPNDSIVLQEIGRVPIL